MNNYRYTPEIKRELRTAWVLFLAFLTFGMFAAIGLMLGYRG